MSVEASTKNAESCVIFCKDDSANYLLIKRIREIIPVAGVVIERNAFGQRWRLLKRRYQRLGLFTVVDQLLYLVIRRILGSLRIYRDVLKIQAGALKDLMDQDVPALMVSSVNQPEVGEFVGRLNPSIVLVSGTSIISRDLLESISAPVLNYHAGITPEYRGVYGAFWAILEGHPELLGVTIHLVDPGIDTGKIVRQQRVKFDYLTDDHISILQKQFLLALDLFSDILKHYSSGKEIPGFDKPKAKSRLYYHPGLSHYILFIMKTGML
jgi:hypothetical protein